MNRALASTFVKVLNRTLEKHPGQWFSRGNPDYNVLFVHNGVSFILSRYLNQFSAPTIGVYDLDERGNVRLSESISSEKEPALYEEFSTIYNRIKDQVAQNKIHVLEKSMGSC